MQLDGQSLEDQWRACAQHAERQGWTCVGLYVDPAVSGRKEHRPAIDKLLGDLRSRTFSTVLFYRVNRMGRNAPAMWATADQIERAGVEVQSATEHFSRHTAAGRLTFNMLASFAQFGSDQLSEVMRGRLAYKASQGEWIGPEPFGYDRAGKTLAPNADAPVVVAAFELYATGLHSDESIARTLNQRGHTTRDWRTGLRGRFGRESVRTILNNPAYLGMVGEHAGQHPALITPELWKQVQAIRAQRTREGGSFKVEPKDGEILAGRVYCAACGSRMYRYQTGRASSRNPRYGCGGRRAAGERQRDCTASMSRQQMVEDAVRELLVSLTIPPSLEQLLKQKAYEVAGATVRSPKGVDHTAVQAKLERLAEVYADGLISREKYQRERAALQAQLHESEEQQIGEPDLAKVLALLQDVPALIRAATREEARAIVAPMLSRVWVEEGKLVAVTPTAAFQPLFVALWRECEVIMGCPTGFEPATS